LHLEVVFDEGADDGVDAGVGGGNTSFASLSWYRTIPVWNFIEPAVSRERPVPSRLRHCSTRGEGRLTELCASSSAI
jgi:hypothetical protein